MIESALHQLSQLSPEQMSVSMLALAVFDLWTGVSLSIKMKTTLSKSLIKGFMLNLVIVISPLVLNILAHLQFIANEKPDFTYINIISLLITLAYMAASGASAIANYSAAYPQSKNFLTQIAYKYLPNEVQTKQAKHGVLPAEEIVKDIVDSVQPKPEDSEDLVTVSRPGFAKVTLPKSLVRDTKGATLVEVPKTPKSEVDDIITPATRTGDEIAVTITGSGVEVTKGAASTLAPEVPKDEKNDELPRG
jgi:hypothetical protein|nr:MAG TPA: holin [Caudoviricetes sp.]